MCRNLPLSWWRLGLYLLSPAAQKTVWAKLKVSCVSQKPLGRKADLGTHLPHRRPDFTAFSASVEIFLFIPAQQCLFCFVFYKISPPQIQSFQLGELCRLSSQLMAILPRNYGFYPFLVRFYNIYFLFCKYNPCSYTLLLMYLNGSSLILSLLLPYHLFLFISLGCFSERAHNCFIIVPESFILETLLQPSKLKAYLHWIFLSHTFLDVA